MTKINLPKPVRAWIAALRSGEYKQGQFALRTAKDKYCCLGVACDLAVEAGVIKKPKLVNNNYDYHHSNGAVLPDKVRKWLGINSDVGSCWVEDRWYSLLVLNDMSRWSFKKIADFIERNWERLAAKPRRRSKNAT